MKKFMASILLLLIVRAWDARTGKLEARLPMHNATIMAEILPRQSFPEIRVGEAIRARMLPESRLLIKGRIFQAYTLRLEGED